MGAPWDHGSKVVTFEGYKRQAVVFDRSFVAAHTVRRLPASRRECTLLFSRFAEHRSCHFATLGRRATSVVESLVVFDDWPYALCVMCERADSDSEKERAQETRHQKKTPRRVEGNDDGAPTASPLEPIEVDMTHDRGQGRKASPDSTNASST
eukprot:scaffold10675_cov121-Isochrysis_galbana.AAC.7